MLEKTGGTKMNSEYICHGGSVLPAEFSHGQITAVPIKRATYFYAQAI